MARRFEADHANAAEGTMLVALAEQALEREDLKTAEAAVRAAADFRTAVSVRARACLEIARQGVRMQDRIERHPEASQSQRETWLRGDMKALERVARKDADHADLWSEVAMLAFVGKLMGLDTRHTRLRAERRAVALEPDEHNHRYGLAQAYRNVGVLPKALEQFRLAAGSASKKVAADAHLGVGAVKFEQGRYEAACDEFERAVELGGGLQATRSLGYAEVQARRHLRAERNLRTVLRAAPDDMAARAWFQESLQDRGRDMEPSRLCIAADWAAHVPGLRALGVLGLRRGCPVRRGSSTAVPVMAMRWRA